MFDDLGILAHLREKGVNAFYTPPTCARSPMTHDEHHERNGMAEHIDTVVVGGGQAGLARSHHLSRRGRKHLRNQALAAWEEKHGIKVRR